MGADQPEVEAEDVDITKENIKLIEAAKAGDLEGVRKGLRLKPRLRIVTSPDDWREGEAALSAMEWGVFPSSCLVAFGVFPSARVEGSTRVFLGARRGAHSLCSSARVEGSIDASLGARRGEHLGRPSILDRGEHL